MKSSEAAQLYRNAGLPVPKDIGDCSTEKIKNTRRKTVDGISFRSTLEADVYQLLKSWEDMGHIRNLVCQPRYVLQEKSRDRHGKAIREIVYTPDFSFERNIERNSVVHLGLWEPVVVEAKGFRTEAYRIRARLFQVKYPEIDFCEWTKETLKANGG